MNPHPRNTAFRILLPALVTLGAALVPLRAVNETYDLSSLPAYKPKERVQGVIRIWGNDVINLVKAWETEFKTQKFNYEARFQDYLLTTPMAFAGPATGEADIGYMGHSWWRSDMKGFEAMFGYPPLEIKYANGSFDEPHGSTPCPVFFVNKDNPLAGLTLEQLDGIYGAERTGGWDGVKWTTAVARGPEKNIRTWGQLGLTGEWADKPIHVYGLDSVLSNWSDLIHKVVFKGGTKWNPAIREVVRGGVETPVDEKLVQAVQDDRYGISFILMKAVEDAHTDVRVLPLAAKEGGRYVMPSAQSLHENTYPLNNAVYLYVNRPPGQPLSPRIKEFLRYVLSREGQEQVVKDKTWIPLNAAQVAEELKKLE
jgi:phosphate transport system substrate-binding protein